MLKLWRKTIEFFRTYPILWVPYLCADLATSCLTWLRQVSTHAIFHWVTTKHLHSVLGGDAVTTNFDHAAMVKASLLAIPVEWGMRYANACFYTMGFILTAVLVVMILRGEKPDLAIALPTLRTTPRRIFRFTLIFCALILVLTALMIAFPSSYLLNAKYHASQLLYSMTITGGELLSTSCSAWIMAPLAIALIRPIDATAVSAERKKLGRIFAAAAGTAAVVLDQLSNQLIIQLIRLMRVSHPKLDIFQPLVSLIVNFPFILLFIALALIAAEDPLEIRSDGVPGTRRLLEALMPLHFGQGREP